MQCCGEPFAVGSQVSWTLGDADTDWLGAVLLYPVRDSAVLTELTMADGWTPDLDDLRFAGYLVDLVTATP